MYFLSVNLLLLLVSSSLLMCYCVYVHAHEGAGHLLVRSGHVCACVWVCARVCAHVCRSEDNSVESLLFYHYMGTRDQNTSIYTAIWMTLLFLKLFFFSYTFERCLCLSRHRPLHSSLILWMFGLKHLKHFLLESAGIYLAFLQGHLGREGVNTEQRNP